MGSLAYFISPHGFGHAARACAVMSAILERMPGVRFEIFTEVPRWFFVDEPAMEPRQPAALAAFPLSAAPFRA